MNPKEVDQSRINLRNAGTLSDRNQLRAMIIARIENEVETLRAAKETIRQDFRRKLERWETRQVEQNAPISAIPTDVHDSRIYRLTAIFALAGEMGLAAWVFQSLGVPWFIGLAAAI